jgi:hypothetical protein
MLGQTLSTFPFSRLETVVDIRRRTSEGETPNRGASDMGGMEWKGFPGGEQISIRSVYVERMAQLRPERRRIDARRLTWLIKYNFAVQH